MYYMSINKNLVHQVGDQTKVVFTVSGSIHPSCCRLVSRMSSNMLTQFQLIHDISRQ